TRLSSTSATSPAGAGERAGDVADVEDNLVVRRDDEALLGRLGFDAEVVRADPGQAVAEVPVAVVEQGERSGCFRREGDLAEVDEQAGRVEARSGGFSVRVETHVVQAAGDRLPSAGVTTGDPDPDHLRERAQH